MLDDIDLECKRERISAYMKVYNALPTTKARRKTHDLQADSPKRKAYRLKKRYGLTLEQWDSLFISQDLCCAICKTTEPGRAYGWATDHDHSHSKPHARGILCHRCNILLGHIENEPDLVTAMLAYLARYAKHI